MTVTVQDIMTCLNELAPFSAAESWDNVGLLVGDLDRPARSLLLALDPTNRLLEEARAVGADTVITHHPAIFRPLPNIDTADPGGRFIETALSARLSIIACHTNLDSAESGVNDALAALLGLSGLEPLVAPAPGQPAGSGLGRIGRYAAAVDKETFITRLLTVLDLPVCAIAGTIPDRITRVALCGGSGSEFAELARRQGADVYLSAEIKHNIARWAEESGFCIIDGTHFATEQPIVAHLASRLREYAAAHGWPVTIRETAGERAPFSYLQKTSASNPQNPTGEVP